MLFITVLKNTLLRCLKTVFAKSLIQHYVRCLLESYAIYLLDLQIQHLLGVSKTCCRDDFSVFIRHLQDIFKMSFYRPGSKCLNLTPCVTNHLSKYNLIFFFFKFITGFFWFRRCPTKGAALRKDPHKGRLQKNFDHLIPSPFLDQ